MKKILLLLVCILICFLSACSPNKEIIESGKYYSIYKEKESATQVCYNIYNSNGETVLSESTSRPLTIEMIDNETVGIEIGMGTGISIHRFYNAKENVFSQDFSYVVANSNGLIAYIYVPKETPFENRKIVVQSIFDRDVFYKEFELDFSDVDTPVVEASFSKDGTSLQITYLSGEEQEQISTILNLDTRD